MNDCIVLNCSQACDCEHDSSLEPEHDSGLPFIEYYRAKMTDNLFYVYYDCTNYSPSWSMWMVPGQEEAL